MKSSIKVGCVSLLLLLPSLHQPLIGSEVLSDTRILESPLAANRFPKSINRFYCDRAIYLKGDPPGQMLGIFSAAVGAPEGSAVNVELRHEGKLMESRRVDLGKFKLPLLVFTFDPSKLKVGKYSIQGSAMEPDGKRIWVGSESEFTISDETRPLTEFPAEGIPLNVHHAREEESGTFPISLGIPMAYGALSANRTPVLVKNGKAIPAQWRVLSPWGPGKDPFVRWLGLSFIAEFDGGTADGYRIMPPGFGAPGETPLRVKESVDEIMVETGKLRFSVSKTRFRGPENISLSGPDGSWSPIGEQPTGPYIKTEQGELFLASACRDVEVRIEENGPIRSVIAAKGWYVHAGNPEQRRCLFSVRLYAYSDKARIDVRHRTILTDGSKELQIDDVGFSVPAMTLDQWVAGISGEKVSGEFQGRERFTLVQEAPDSVHLNDQTLSDRQSDGWVLFEGGQKSALCLLRDIWRKFPKEISATRNEVTFHSWPADGREVFGEKEQLDRKNIHRALFAHQGKAMNLELPRSYYDRLLEWNKEAKWDYENTSHIGFKSTAEGVSMSTDFAIEYLPQSEPVSKIEKIASLWQQNPHAFTSPEWNAETGVFGPIAKLDEKRWEQAERLLNESFPQGMMNLAKLGNNYGMWIFGNTNNSWDLSLGVPRLHRLWQNSHYGHVAIPWILYGRSGNPKLIEYARANTGNLMDVGIAHYASEDTQNTVSKKRPGTLYHAKGWLPWGARLKGEFTNDLDLGYLQHWTNPKAFLFKFYAEVDWDALDVFNTWLDGMMKFQRYESKYGPGRELTCSLSEMIDIYQEAWDPLLIGYLRPMGDSALAVPFQEYKLKTDFAFFNRTWPMRYYELVRDPKVIENLEVALKTNNPYLGVGAFLYSKTGKKEYLERLKAPFYNGIHSVHMSENDPLDGFGPYSAAQKMRELEEYPYVLKAYEDAGLTGIPDGIDRRGTSQYPAAGVRIGAKEGSALKVLALNPDGRDFTVRLQTVAAIDMNPTGLSIFSPSGKEIETMTMHSSGDKIRYAGKDVREVEVKAQGEKGIYVLNFTGNGPIYSAPVTDLPHEIAELPRRGMSGRARVQGFLCSDKETGIKFSNPPYHSRYSATFIRLKNVDTGEIKQTTLLDGSARNTEEFMLKDGGKGRVLYEILTIHPDQGPAFSFQEATSPVYFALTEDDLTSVRGEMEKEKTDSDNH